MFSMSFHKNQNVFYLLATSIQHSKKSHYKGNGVILCHWILNQKSHFSLLLLSFSPLPSSLRLFLTYLNIRKNMGQQGRLLHVWWLDKFIGCVSYLSSLFPLVSSLFLSFSPPLLLFLILLLLLSLFSPSLLLSSSVVAHIHLFLSSLFPSVLTFFCFEDLFCGVGF